jgi:hypothetical protein
MDGRGHFRLGPERKGDSNLLISVDRFGHLECTERNKSQYRGVHDGQFPSARDTSHLKALVEATFR